MSQSKIEVSGDRPVDPLSADTFSSSTAPRGAAIQVTGVSHAFRSRGSEEPVVALDNVSIDFPPGQFVALVGPSGCGKTTLLNMIAGLLSPLTGEVRIGGDLVAGPTRHTGYMFARDALLPWRTASSNVELGLEIRGLSRSQRRQRAKEVLDLVGLRGFEDAHPRQLSQGMRQRVAIARTLAPDPDTLLLDEPFGALDAQTKIKLQAEFTRIWEGSGKTVVFVTHDLSEAVLLADRVVVFAARPGRIVDDFVIDLPRPRNTEELLFNDRYRSLHQRTWQSLKGVMTDES